MAQTRTKRKNTSNKIGENFEKKVQSVMEKLKKDKIAYMNKVPTEFKIVRGNFGRIVSAFPVSASKFVDYTGYVKGVGHCDIETKTTKNKTSFPLNNIKDTQFDFFEYMYYEMGCVHGYYIIEFREHKEIYLVKAIEIDNFRKTETRKSIPYKWFKEHGVLLDKNLNFIDYIKSPSQ